VTANGDVRHDDVTVNSLFHFKKLKSMQLRHNSTLKGGKKGQTQQIFNWIVPKRKY
jgi:hypothetical protein